MIPARRWSPRGVASILADRLCAALLARADGGPAGEQLQAAIEQIRVGVTTATAGPLRRYRT